MAVDNFVYFLICMWYITSMYTHRGLVDIPKEERTGIKNNIKYTLYKEGDKMIKLCICEDCDTEFLFYGQKKCRACEYLTCRACDKEVDSQGKLVFRKNYKTLVKPEQKYICKQCYNKVAGNKNLKLVKLSKREGWHI